MTASIIIITKNQKDFLQKTIPILLSQVFKEKYEIIVVDSGSSDGAMGYVKKQPVKLINIPPETFNYGNAFNTGLKYARGDFILRLSGDCIPKNNKWLQEMLSPFKNDKVGGTFGKYITTGKSGYDYPEFWPASRFPEKLTTYSIKPYPFMGVFELGESRDLLTNFTGANCAVRGTILRKRPFSEKLFAAEDAEYAWFLHLNGYDIVCNPKAIVIHEHPVDPPSLGVIKDLKKNIVWRFQLNWEIFKYWVSRYK